MVGMELYKKFKEIKSQSRDTASSSYLARIDKYIQEIEDESEENPLLKKYCHELLGILDDNKSLIKGGKINDFMQKFGEAFFLLLCLRKGVTLDRVPEQQKKTPDFKNLLEGKEVAHFEVKTLSVVNGDYNLNDDLENSLTTQIDINEQLNSGKRIAIGEMEISPYGSLNGGKPITHVVKTLISKAKNNIKSGQYDYKNTFLVLNLAMLPSYSESVKGLCSSYIDDYLFQKPITGDLWMTGFARSGMIVHGNPDFEGKPCIEGIIDITGVLADESYQNIAGIIFVIYPLGSEVEIFGLFRHADFNRWNDEEKDLLTMLLSLVEHKWNDEEDSNTWKLLESKD